MNKYLQMIYARNFARAHPYRRNPYLQGLGDGTFGGGSFGGGTYAGGGGGGGSITIGGQSYQTPYGTAPGGGYSLGDELSQTAGSGGMSNTGTGANFLTQIGGFLKSMFGNVTGTQAPAAPGSYQGTQVAAQGGSQPASQPYSGNTPQAPQNAPAAPSGVLALVQAHPIATISVAAAVALLIASSKGSAAPAKS